MARHSLEATAVFWVVVGLPVFAVLFGGSAGSALASAPSREAELLLPLSPARRAWGGLVAAAAQLSWVAALVLGLSALIALLMRKAGSELELWSVLSSIRSGGAWLRAGSLSGPSLAAGTLAYMLAASYLGSYLFRHGVLGGLLGLLLGATMFVSLTFGLGIEAFFPGRSFSPQARLILAAAVGGCGWALHELAPWAERKSRRSPWSLAALAALAVLGAAAALVAAVLASRSVMRVTRILDDRPMPQGSFLPEPADGVLLQSVAGELLWATSDGARRSLVPAPRGWRWPAWRHASVNRDAGGRYWLLVHEGDLPDKSKQYAVWTGNPAAGLSLATRLTDQYYLDLESAGGRVVLVSPRGIARIAAPGRQTEWQSFRLEPLGKEPPRRPAGRFFELRNPDRPEVLLHGRNPSEPSELIPLHRLPRFGSERVDLLGFEEGRLRLRSGDVLLAVDSKTGKVHSTLPLARPGTLPGWIQVKVGRGGVFVQAGGELSFLTWEGERRRLGD